MNSEIDRSVRRKRPSSSDLAAIVLAAIAIDDRKHDLSVRWERIVRGDRG